MVPLSRFRVVEVGIGPAFGIATMMLADFGAAVIKIVPKGAAYWGASAQGDATRELLGKLGYSAEASLLESHTVYAREAA